MRNSNSSERLGLRALVLASAIVSTSACAPAPMDAGNPTAKGGSSGSGLGGSGGTSPSGSGGTAPSGSGGTTTSGSGGTTSSGTGGSSSSGSGGSSSGSGGTGQMATGGRMMMGGSGGMTGSGGTMMMGTGGTTGAPDAGGSADMGGAGAPTFTMVYAMLIMPSCAGCHTAAAAGNHKGVILANKAMALTTMKSVAGTIVPNMGAMSNLVKLLGGTGTGTAKKMPPNGTAATAAQIKLVTDWINGGALDN